MPKISTFMYCEQAGIDQNTQKTIINGPLHIFTPPFVPSVFSFSIVFGVIGFEGTEENVINLKFLNWDGKVLVDTGEIIVNAENQHHEEKTPLPSEAQGFIANMDFRNVVMDSEGIYKTQIYINHKLEGEFPIQVLDSRRGRK